jgi:hypothetical protein
MVILSAATLILVSVFTGLVAWRLYRMARELQADLMPVIAAIQDTADTVRDTTGYVGKRAVSPALGVVGAASGALELYGQLRELYRGLRRSDAEDSGGS